MNQARSLLGAGALTGLLVTGAFTLLRTAEPADALSELPGALPEPSASCREERDRAQHAARSALHVARARMQRYPFAPRDGRDALARFAEAADCAQLAGDPELARDASAQLAKARERIERDIRDRAQRYVLLRKRGRLDEAAEDVAYLSALGWPDRGTLFEQLRIDRDVLEDKTRKASR